MTDPTLVAEPSVSPTLDRNLAMFGYLCLFLTVFFAGVPAVIAAIIAYARKADADPIGASHYRFQIRTFWWSFGLTLLSVSAGIAAVVQGIWRLVGSNWGSPNPKPVLIAVQNAGVTGGSAADTLAAVSWSPWVLLAACILLFSVAVLWTWVASIWGATRLGLGKPVGRV